MDNPEDDSENPPPIEDLLPETIEGVARRLRATRTFIDRVYRESEMDALWTLADIAVSGLKENQWRGAEFPPRPELPHATSEDFTELAKLIFQAHDTNAEGHSYDAADILMEAARVSEAALKK